MKAVMLGHDDIDRAHEFGQKHQQPFFDQAFSAVAFLIHHVTVFEAEIRINFQITGGDSGTGMVPASPGAGEVARDSAMPAMLERDANVRGGAAPALRYHNYLFGNH